LGVLWEIELGQPGFASFLDQNWLEGADRPGAAQHFTAVLTALRRRGVIDEEGRPLGVTTPAGEKPSRPWDAPPLRGGRRASAPARPVLDQKELTCAVERENRRERIVLIDGAGKPRRGPQHIGGHDSLAGSSAPPPVMMWNARQR